MGGVFSINPIQVFQAITNNEVGTLESLLKRGVNVNCLFENNTPIHAAINQRNYDIVKILIEHGADLNARNYHVFFFLPLQTPLILATEKGLLDVVKLLVENGANLELQDYDIKLMEMEILLFIFQYPPDHCQLQNI